MENVFGIPIGDTVAAAMDLTVNEVRADVSRRFEFRWHNPDIILPSPDAIHEYVTTEGENIYGSDIEIVERLNNFLEYKFLAERDAIPEPEPDADFITLISDPEEAVGIFLGVAPASRPFSLNINKSFIKVQHDPRFAYNAPLSMIDLSLEWNSRSGSNDADGVTIADVVNLIHPKVVAAPGVAWWDDTAYSMEHLISAVDRSQFPENEALLWAVMATYDDTGSLPTGTLEDNLAHAAEIAKTYSATQFMGMYEYGFKNSKQVFEFFDAGLDPVTHQSYLRYGMKDFARIAEAYKYGIDAALAARM